MIPLHYMRVVQLVYQMMSWRNCVSKTELRQVVTEFQTTDARENLDVRLRVVNPRGLGALNPG